MSDEPRKARRRWRPIAAVAAVVVVAAGVWVVADLVGSGGCVDITEPESYKVSKAGDNGVPTAISPNGRYLLGPFHGTEQNTFTLWEDDESREVEIPADVEAGETVTAVDVNDSGVVIGTIEALNGHQSTYRSWRYQDGEVTELTVPDGLEEPRVTALNGDGTVLGSAYGGGSDPDAALRWEPGRAEAEELTDMPEDEEEFDAFSPSDISDDGVIVGTFRSSIWVWTAEDGARELSPKPAEGYYDWPTITDDRVAAGNLLWESTDGDEHQQIGGASLRLNTIDGCGRAYGSSTGVHGEAIVTDGGKPRKLPQLKEPVYEEYPEEPEFPLGEVTGASADGSILIGESNGWPAIWRYR